jgi:hypothetical protein
LPALPRSDDHLRNCLIDAKVIRNDASAIDALDKMASSAIVSTLISEINSHAE